MMTRFFEEENTDVRQLSPLTLAFVGDSVYDLLVRERIVCGANRPANDLHALAVRQVRASAQAQAAQSILPYLTEAETSVFKRGRNAKTAHIAKNATTGEYHTATGLEALFGYLYLSGQAERIKELFLLTERAQTDDEKEKSAGAAR